MSDGATVTLLHALKHAQAGHWPVARAVGSVTLAFDQRFRRRLRLELDEGGVILLDLPRAVALADGDGLELDTGDWIAVKAAHEPLVEVSAGDHDHLMRIAWHLGNRHLPTEIGPGWLRIRPDHVIEAMIVGLGGTVRHVEAPFQPEGGAYGGRGHAHQGHHHD
ncbi:MAG: urease accessory protein UreE [Pseudomonadota bacterium]